MDYKETSIDSLSCDSYATLYTCEQKWMQKIKQLHQEYPNEVTIITDSSEYMNVHIPKSWVKIKPPRKMNLSEEQRQAAAARLAEARKNKKGLS